MSAIFFYLVIYLAGYFAIKVINLLTVKPLVHNHYVMSLIAVFLVAPYHAYMIVSTPPRQMQDTSMEYALAVYVLMPVVVVTMGAFYAMWNKKTDDQDDD